MHKSFNDFLFQKVYGSTQNQDFADEKVSIFSCILGIVHLYAILSMDSIKCCVNNPTKFSKAIKKY